MDMSHTTVKLETMTAESKQHAWKLETMRQKYEALMKKVEDLAKENELLKRELERREVEENLRREKKVMEEKEMKKSYTSAVGNAKPVDTAKWEPEIEERPLVKQGDAQKEPNSAKSYSDATGITLEEQANGNMERRRKAFYLDDEEVDSIPTRRSSCNDEQEEKAHGRRKGSRHNSEAGKKASDKDKDPIMKMSQGRRLPKRSCDDERDETIQMRISDSPFSIGLNPALCACDRRRNDIKGGGMW